MSTLNWSTSLGSTTAYGNNSLQQGPARGKVLRTVYVDLRWSRGFWYYWEQARTDQDRVNHKSASLINPAKACLKNKTKQNLTIVVFASWQLGCIFLVCGSLIHQGVAQRGWHYRVFHTPSELSCLWVLESSKAQWKRQSWSEDKF